MKLSAKTLILSVAGLALLSTPAFALDFQWTFENFNGDVGAPTDIVTGKILGLNDNSFNFQPVTVTFDSVSPPGDLDPAFTTPYQWTDSGVFLVIGGSLLGSIWSSNDGTYAINLDAGIPLLSIPGNPPFVSTSDFSKYYLGGSITFTPLSSVPDGGSTQILLGLGLAGLGLIRRKLA